MHLNDSWNDPDILTEYLAKQLISGRLGLFLGAGISKFYDLPSWEELVRRMCYNAGVDFNSGDNWENKVEFLKKVIFKNNNKDFRDSVYQALYKDIKLDFSRIRKNETLAAIGSLVMSSKRGSISKIITLNFDDLLENYLEFHGFTTSIIASEKHWAQNVDAVVYHPHGLIPIGNRKNGAFDEKIVLSSSEFLSIMENKAWQSILKSALRTHTFLYLGLSGQDMHLKYLLHELTSEHVISNERIRYHGVRIDTLDGDDEMAQILEEGGVHTHKIDDFSEMPEFLFKICQRARELRS